MKFKLKTEYIKYIELYQSVNKIRLEVKNIDENHIFLYTKYNPNYLRLRSQDVKVNFICVDGLYRIKTSILKFEKAEPYLIFVLKTPAEMEFEQKRNYFRIDSSIGCICETNIDGVVSQYSGVITNISANGVCAIFPNYFITDESCIFKFILENKEFALKARYVRSENSNSGYKASFTFIEISEADKDFISRICLKKELEIRRKNLL